VAAPSPDKPTTIPIFEEQLQIGRRTIEGETVSITIKPIEVPMHESVQLRTEHIVVERTPGNGRPIEMDEHAFEPRTIELTEMTEVPMAAIRPVVTNMVTIRKESRQRSEHVQDRVRGNTVDIVRELQRAPEARKMTTVVPAGEVNIPVSKAVGNTLQNNVQLPASIAEVKQNLMIDKREVPEAIVRVQIRPTETPVEQTVSLREEYVVVERAPVTTSTGDVPADVFKDKTFYVKTQKEVPVITKRPVLKEMLTIRKDTDTEQRTIEAKLLETSIALADPSPQTAR
jgi:stress response protein YsnF